MKKYKIYISLTLLFSSFWMGISYGYNQQGFSQYQEGKDGISFNCINQCIIELGKKDKIEYLNLDGTVDGNGIIGYGFLVGNQISLLNQYNIALSSSINEYINFLDSELYLSSIPGDTDLILLVNGNINGNIKISANKFSIEERVKQGRNSFWSFDSFRPYTINLLYGPMVNGKNFNKGFYILFIIFLIILLFTRKSKRFKIKALLIGLLILWFIYDVRMGLEGINFYYDDYKNYISQDKYEKTYRDRGDFYSFVDFVHDKLVFEGVNDFEQIGFFTDNTRPFPGSMKYFLYPYRVIMNKDVGKYVVVYQSSNVEVINSNKILIDKNEINGSMIKYKDYAFIFVKNN